MGDPKKHRKKYSTPGHPWQRARIDEEKPLMAEYGFKNKTEIWRMGSFLRSATAQAKKLVTLSGPQAEKEKGLLLSRLRKYGILSPEAGLADILSISLRDVLERRFQTQVYKQGFAATINQARQLITHEHLCIAGKVVTSPSRLLTVTEQSQISYRPNSKFNDPEHPERVAAKKIKEQGMEAVKSDSSAERPVKREAKKEKSADADKNVKESKPAEQKKAPAQKKPKDKTEKDKAESGK